MPKRKSPARAPRPRWAFEERSRNVHVFRVHLPAVGDEQYFLLQSDVHIDNPHCDRDLWTRHLDEAKARHAPVLDCGDFHCVMQSRGDRRRSRKGVRSEHEDHGYLDKVLNESTELLMPYKHLVTLRGLGNHETAVRTHCDTDLTERLAERLRMKGGIARAGGFSGYVVFRVTGHGGDIRAIKLWYFHGSGGGGPVTRGVIQTNRQAVFVSDADIVWNGHTHDSWHVPIPRVRLSSHDEIIQTRQVHVRTPGYKDEYGTGMDGWHVERGGAPKPLGAAWLRIFREDHAGGRGVGFEIREAV